MSDGAATLMMLVRAGAFILAATVIVSPAVMK